MVFVFDRQKVSETDRQTDGNMDRNLYVNVNFIQTNTDRRTENHGEGNWRQTNLTNRQTDV